MNYAQLNQDNICIGISKLNGEVQEYNYSDNNNFNPVTGESNISQTFVSRMIPIEVYSENYIGLKYNENGTWSAIE